MNRKANAVWTGTGLEGKGTITTQSGAFTDQPYGFVARFQSEDGKAGTNPEELIAAAHSSCFTMALAFRLTAAGHPAAEIRTEARVEMVKGDAGWSIPSIHLTTSVKATGLDDAKLQELAADAKANCPVSRALRPDITLTATLDIASRG